MMLTEKYDPIVSFQVDCAEIRELLSYLECPYRKSVSKGVKQRVCWHLHDLLGIYYNEINRLSNKRKKYEKENKNEEI